MNLAELPATPPAPVRRPGPAPQRPAARDAALGPTPRDPGADRLEISTGIRLRAAGAFLNPDDAPEGAGNEAMATGRRLAFRFSMSRSLHASSPLSSGEDLGPMLDREEIVKGYLLLVTMFLGDPESDDRLDRFVGRVNALLEGGEGADLAEELSRIFEDGGQPGGEEDLVRAVARFMAHLRLRVTASGEAASVPPAEPAEQVSDPLVLDLNGDGVRTTGLEAGVGFDISGDGRMKLVSFVTGDDALLALDRNGNGVVDDGRELFGDQNGAANGFQELRRHDQNGDGRIDDHDPVFDRLRLFQDRNGDGISQTGELRGLRPAGIEEIHLGYEEIAESVAGGDRAAQRSSFVRRDGSRGGVLDLLLRYRVHPPRGRAAGVDLRA